MSHADKPWQVIVPVKRLTQAKTRLSGEPEARQDLVIAMALDTLAAIRSCPLVSRIWLVTADTSLAARLTSQSTTLLREAPGEPGGLNSALADAIASIQSQQPAVNLALVVADLPALRSEDVTDVLKQASHVPASFVADSAGSGTTAVFLQGGSKVALSFGVGSADRHRAEGLVLLAAGSSLRQDVDTLADLSTAAKLGVGRFTAAAMARRLR